MENQNIIKMKKIKIVRWVLLIFIILSILYNLNIFSSIDEEPGFVTGYIFGYVLIILAIVYVTKDKKKGIDFGLVINIDSKVLYSKRKEEFGKPINLILTSFYKQNAIQYSHDGEERYLTGLKIVGGNALFKKNKEVKSFRKILNDIIVFLKLNKIIFTTDLYTPKPFKKEVMDLALSSAEAISGEKTK